MGATISFTIPIAVNLISKEDFSYFAKGILIGIVQFLLNASWRNSNGHTLNIDMDKHNTSNSFIRINCIWII